MIFAPYGSELEIVLKTSHYKDDFSSIFSRYQAIINQIKKLKVKKIHAYADLVGVHLGRGPFLMLPNGLEYNLDLLDRIKKDCLNYLMEYKKALIKNKLAQIPNLNELKQSFCGFKDKIKSVNTELYDSLQSEFDEFSKWIEFYFSHPKLALLFYRFKKLPYQLIKDTKRTYKKVFK